MQQNQNTRLSTFRYTLCYKTYSHTISDSVFFSLLWCNLRDLLTNIRSKSSHWSAALKQRLKLVSVHNNGHFREIKTMNWWRNKGESTHNGRHVVALVGGGHQSAEVRLTAHAHWRRTLILHVFGNASWRQQPGGGAVVTVAAVSCWQTQAFIMIHHRSTSGPLGQLDEGNLMWKVSRFIEDPLWSTVLSVIGFNLIHLSILFIYLLLLFYQSYVLLYLVLIILFILSQLIIICTLMCNILCFNTQLMCDTLFTLQFLRTFNQFHLVICSKI